MGFIWEKRLILGFSRKNILKISQSPQRYEIYDTMDSMETIHTVVNYRTDTVKYRTGAVWYGTARFNSLYML